MKDNKAILVCKQKYSIINWHIIFNDDYEKVRVHGKKNCFCYRRSSSMNLFVYQPQPHSLTLYICLTSFKIVEPRIKIWPKTGSGNPAFYSVMSVQEVLPDSI